MGPEWVRIDLPELFSTEKPDIRPNKSKQIQNEAFVFLLLTPSSECSLALPPLGGRLSKKNSNNKGLGGFRQTLESCCYSDWAFIETATPLAKMSSGPTWITTRDRVSFFSTLFHRDTVTLHCCHP